MGRMERAWFECVVRCVSVGSWVRAAAHVMRRSTLGWGVLEKESRQNCSPRWEVIVLKGSGE